ncbi:aspartyl-phosphate phosphatase Spo0E family protein [Priestia megaterium]
MNILATNNGISTHEVIIMSQKLDEEIIMLQKILYEIHSQ